jgi:hypothetical protein
VVLGLRARWLHKAGADETPVECVESRKIPLFRSVPIGVGFSATLL